MKPTVSEHVPLPALLVATATPDEPGCRRRRLLWHEAGAAINPAVTAVGRRRCPSIRPRAARLGFTYFVFDRELGQQYFSVGSEIPFASDPSLWGTLQLVRD